MAITARNGASPHLKWLELNGDGILHECAVMKTDSHGNTYYFELGKIDAIDKQRMARLLQNRNADRHELWDLMSQTTLNNGVNALTYFHQLVKIISPDGVKYTPRGGVIGTERRAGEVAIKDVSGVNPLGQNAPADGFADANPSVTDNK